MNYFHIIIIGFALFALSRAVLRLKDRKISISQFSLWLTLWGSLILLTIYPPFLDELAKITGVAKGPDILIYLGIIILFYSFFRFYMKINSLQQKLTFTIRKIAKMEARNEHEKEQR